MFVISQRKLGSTMQDESDPKMAIIPMGRVAGTVVVQPDKIETPVLHTEKILIMENIIEPDWVIHYRTKPRGRWLRWVAAFIQMFTGVFLATIFYMIPTDPFVSPFHNWKNPVIIFLLICFLGKTLVDTLFYDHYQP